MTQKPMIFPTFFLSGFECSTFDWKDQGRRDLVEETQHRSHADEDYRFLASLGLGVAREGIPWPLVERGAGTYDFSPVESFAAAQKRWKVTPIWDLCHYGVPDSCDPFDDQFANRFAAYAAAAARWVLEQQPHGPWFFTPINEISHFALMGGAWGWCAPFRKSAGDRRRLGMALAKADIFAAKAIRAVIPEARLIHIEPLLHVVPPRDRPDLAEAAHRAECVEPYEALDAIAGRTHPEWGGSPELLDIVGFNNYAFGQQEYKPEGGPYPALKPDDDRIVPVFDLILRGYRRYGRPIIIAETSGLKGGRDDWFRDLLLECMAAVNSGVDLHGICLFPGVDMPSWSEGGWLHNGIADLEELPSGTLMRKPCVAYVQELRRWQRKLKRVESLDEDPLDTPVELQDIVEAAREWKPRPDPDWY
ncbi:b-glycosidase [Sphingomonas ginkgonis]|uniref:B-glycosidase n=1 Tax=Sphingomonas ginkgonis TaxID=2315330 RepID=A0A429V812_9SPHN|nr:b-glycosidase [Sphingomonas ginkgonis]RST30100.1 b-glycosidase [Sphingomonas ginkgonis]